MSIKKLLDASQKEFGNQVRAGSEVSKVEALSTGVPSLDVALGIGGWPRGGITMIYGLASSGKSALAYTTIAEVQKRGGYGAIVDLEGAFDPEWARKLGVDPDNVIIFSPTSGEEVIQHMYFCSGHELLDVVILDSVGAMASERELQEDGKKQAFGQSGLITDMVKKIHPRVFKNNQVALLINQARDTQTHNNLPLIHPPGGHALRHACAIILHVKPGRERYEYEKLQVGARPIGVIEKSKVAPPKREAQWDFYFAPTPEHAVGIDIERSLIDSAMMTGVVKQNGAMYTFNEEKAIKGKDNFIQWLKDNPEKLNLLKKQFYTKFEELRSSIDG